MVENKENNNKTEKQQEKPATLDDIKEMRRMMTHIVNNQSGLAAEIKDIKQRVSSKEQNQATRYFVTFAILGVVIILSFFFYFRSQSANYENQSRIREEHNNYLEKEVAELKDKIFSMENNDIMAYNLYIALKEGDPGNALKRYDEFNLSALSRLERTIIDNETSMIKQKAAVKTYEEGETLFKRKSYEAAVDKFKESLDISSNGDHIANLFYLTALSYYRIKDYNKAAIAFERFLFINTKKDFPKDRSELLLGVCYEKMNQLERAKNFYEQSMRENRHNRYFPTIRDRVKNIEKKMEKQKESNLD
ncbi:outer membrane protein assembly factor BamD [bacterium]|nr:outer membrane protein assembly factor BamD [bacterium]